MKDCYYDLGLHFILLYDYSQSYILKLRDRHNFSEALMVSATLAGRIVVEFFNMLFLVLKNN